MTQTPVYLSHFGLSQPPFAKNVADGELWVPPTKEELVAELLEEFELVAEAAVVFRFEGDFQDEFLTVPFHEKGGGGASGAEAGFDAEAAGEDFADGGLERVGARSVVVG